MDSQLRKAQREGGACYLKEKVRAGQISEARVKTAAALGHEASRLLYDEPQVQWQRMKTTTVSLVSITGVETPKPVEFTSLDHEEKMKCIAVLSDREQNNFSLDLLKDLPDAPPSDYEGLFRLSKHSISFRNQAYRQWLVDLQHYIGYTPESCVAQVCNWLLEHVADKDKEEQRQKDLLIGYLGVS